MLPTKLAGCDWKVFAGVGSLFVFIFVAIILLYGAAGPVEVKQSKPHVVEKPPVETNYNVSGGGSLPANIYGFWGASDAVGSMLNFALVCFVVLIMFQITAKVF